MTQMHFKDFKLLADEIKTQEKRQISNHKQRELLKWIEEKKKIALHLRDLFQIDYDQAYAMIVGSEEIPQEWTEPKLRWYLFLENMPVGILVHAEIQHGGQVRVSVSTSQTTHSVRSTKELVEEIEALQPRDKYKESQN